MLRSGESFRYFAVYLLEVLHARFAEVNLAEIVVLRGRRGVGMQWTLFEEHRQGVIDLP